MLAERKTDKTYRRGQTDKSAFTTIVECIFIFFNRHSFLRSEKCGHTGGPGLDRKRGSCHFVQIIGRAATTLAPVSTMIAILPFVTNLAAEHNTATNWLGFTASIVIYSF